MHYTGTIWRPPYESGSLLLEAAAGCTHHRCKFCTLYDELPFRFRLSPLEDIEADLAEAQELLRGQLVQRVFLVGANPFVLQTERLKAIAGRIRRYFPECRTIGCFARDAVVGAAGGRLQQQGAGFIADEALRELRRLGYDGLTIGVETGYDPALHFMDKGYQARDIVEQAHRLDEAGIAYHFFYLAGIAGAGRGEAAALASASVFNQTNPRILGSSMLTVYPQSRLFSEMQAGRWTEAGEVEKLEELKTLVEHLERPLYFAALGASNAVSVHGFLPEERDAVAAKLARACRPEHEDALRRYRAGLRHL